MVSIKKITFSISFIFLILISSCSTSNVKYEKKSVELDYQKSVKQAKDIESLVPAKVMHDLTLTLYGSKELVKDPVALSFDENGILYYVRTQRRRESEQDIRRRRHWILEVMAIQTPEGRRNFLKKKYSKGTADAEKYLIDGNSDGVKDYRDLMVKKEEVWRIEDRNQDGVADKAVRILADFNDFYSDVANGLEVFENTIYVPIAPDVWKLEDRDQDGAIDKKTSISHGYGVHVAYGGHGMSGIIVGPDGRLWWSAGDIGLSTTDKEGKKWHLPNEGFIARSELDGSNFEIFAKGLRNTHEFTFDQYGNLITEDNDGDIGVFRGIREQERLMYLIDGSDSGWRINWQFGKYKDPKNNNYNPWTHEMMYIPHWEGQATYFLPTIANYVSGPTGFIYNPGTALSREWNNHFFVSSFRGSPEKSTVHAFTLQPNGAGFKLSKSKAILSGVLATGLDFGSDGALYVADWINGWKTKNEGRIWKLDVPNMKETKLRLETKALIEDDFSDNPETELEKALFHPDMRVRQKGQFELAKREKKGKAILQKVAIQQENQLARIHALWGMGQLIRKDQLDPKALEPFLSDNDPEIIAQAAKLIGDVKHPNSNNKLVQLLKSEHPRVAFFAMEALGRVKHEGAVQGIIDLMIRNDDQDILLRHGGMIALGRIGADEALLELKKHSSKAARTIAVLALRRMGSQKVADFLYDKNEQIATEAARAINDDFSIEAAIPALAKSLLKTSFTNEEFLRRAINANSRQGKDENIQNLLTYAQNEQSPEAMRAEAIATLGVWGEPSTLDRVDGTYRGEVKRDINLVSKELKQIIPTLIQSGNNQIVLESIKAMKFLKLKDLELAVFKLFQSHAASPSVRVTSLQSLNYLKSKYLSDALIQALQSKKKSLRSAGLLLITKSGLPKLKALELLEKVIATETSSIHEKQSALKALRAYKKEKKTIEILDGLLNQYMSGEFEMSILLELEKTIDKVSSELQSKLTAYRQSKEKEDPNFSFDSALMGGNAKNGKRIFQNNVSAQCTRCHALVKRKNSVGPALGDVGHRLSREKILESIVNPSAELADGYKVLSLTTKSGEIISGMVVKETDYYMHLKLANGAVQKINYSEVESKQSLPSSMPAMGTLLDKQTIRDLVAYLVTLKGNH